MKIKSFKILNFAFILTLFACSSPQSENSSSDEVSDVDKSEMVANDMSSEDVSAFYQVPTPNELFAVLKNTTTTYNKEILNDISNKDNYNTKILRGLNFGVYAADLAYASSMGNIEDATQIFETIRVLSQQLQIENALDEVILQRIKSNKESSNADSLFYLSNEVYYNAYSYLENNKRSDVLGMIVLGGWIEGLNIILNLGDYQEDSEVVQRIADQKLTLENLLIFISRIDDQELNKVVANLSPIEEVFKSVVEETGESELSTSTFTDSNGETVAMFGGGSSITVTKDQFDQLKNIVEELRNSIIEGALY
jgi:hypothetical protein